MSSSTSNFEENDFRFMVFVIDNCETLFFFKLDTILYTYGGFSNLFSVNTKIYNLRLRDEELNALTALVDRDIPQLFT